MICPPVRSFAPPRVRSMTAGGLVETGTAGIPETLVFRRNAGRSGLLAFMESGDALGQLYLE